AGGSGGRPGVGRGAAVHPLGMGPGRRPAHPPTATPTRAAKGFGPRPSTASTWLGTVTDNPSDLFDPARPPAAARARTPPCPSGWTAGFPLVVPRLTSRVR